MNDRFERRSAQRREVNRLVCSDVDEANQGDVVTAHHVQPQRHKLDAILRRQQQLNGQ